MTIEQSGTSPRENFEFAEAASRIKAERNLRVSMILAQSLNGVIGRDGDLPWRIPEDLKLFKEVTMNGTLIMGRRTFESINRVLPGRTMIVVSTRSTAELALPEGVRHSATPLTALQDAPRDTPVFIIGGANMYDHFFAAADELLITLVKRLVVGDTRFDAFDRCDPEAWEQVERRSLTDEAELFRFTGVGRAP